jgi:translation initiation factor 2 subunit 1
MILEIPEEGELVLVTSKQITPHGVYVSLDEYNNMKGFLHRSQIATGRVRHIERFVRIGQKEVLKVIRVNKFRQEVDLSLKQVTGQEKKEKLIDVKQSEKAKKIMDSIKNKLNISEENLSDYIKSIEEKFDSLYLALEEIVREGGEKISGLNIPQQFIDSLVEVSREKITLPRVEISGTLEVSSPLSNGIEVVKKALSIAEKSDNNSVKVSISYMSASKYRIAVEADEYKSAEKALKNALDSVKNEMKKKGTMNFLRKN